jgi:hypothetical protein
MTEISNDAVFREALDRLPVAQQRLVGKLFVDSVIDLADNPKIRSAVDNALAADSTQEDMRDAFRRVKALAIESYTLCGRDADWLSQASHFVAAAAAANLVPEDQETQCRNLAWATAMNARMARMCENIVRGTSGEGVEAQRQYRILEDFLAAG